MPFHRHSEQKASEVNNNRSPAHRWNTIPFTPPPSQMMHRSIQKNVSARGLNSQNHRFRIARPGQPFIIHVNLRREHFEPVALIVQQCHGISDHHVRKLAHRLATLKNLLMTFKNDLRVKIICEGQTLFVVLNEREDVEAGEFGAAVQES